MDIEFVDEPPRWTRPPKPDAFKAALQANPRMWACHPERQWVSRRQILAAAGFEVMCVNTTPDNMCDLWAMWPGKKLPPAVEPLDVEFHLRAPRPARRSPDPRHEQFLHELQLHPGRWALFPDRVWASTASRWRNKGFRVRKRNVDDISHTCDLWAMWPTEADQK